MVAIICLRISPSKESIFYFVSDLLRAARKLSVAKVKRRPLSHGRDNRFVQLQTSQHPNGQVIGSILPNTLVLLLDQSVAIHERHERRRTSESPHGPKKTQGDGRFVC